MLGRNVACPQGNMQPRGGFGRGLYGGRGGDRTCFVCGKWGYIAKNYWQRKERERRIVETLQESAKDNREQ